MLHLLIPFDNEDESRGEYFAASQENFLSQLEKTENLSFDLLDSNTCYSNSIDFYIRKLNGSPFIFVAYLHGSTDALFISDHEYVNSQNAYFFSDTLFYACSCLSAVKLGQNLVNNGCKVFLGYNKTISCVNNEVEPIFYHCENSFMINFLNSSLTIQECLSLMYDEYEKMKIHLIKNYSALQASVLEDNLNAFEVIYSNPKYSQLTNQDFHFHL